MELKTSGFFFNVVPEFSVSLGSRSNIERARSAVVSSLADVILVSGKMAGSESDPLIIREIKENIDVPVLVNTGVNQDNVKEYLSIADGAIVGSSLKIDGYTWNPVDLDRVKRLMTLVKEFR